MNPSQPKIASFEPTFPPVSSFLILNDPPLAEIGKRLSRAALQQVACVANPDTILAWYRRLIARKFEGSGFIRGQWHLLYDRYTKFSAAFLDVLRTSGVPPLALPPRSPNLNAFAERWEGAIRQECLSKLILFGETSRRRALNEYIDHHHFERNHQDKGNLLLLPSPDAAARCGKIRCRDRLGGLLKFYSRVA